MPLKSHLQRETIEAAGVPHFTAALYLMDTMEIIFEQEGFIMTESLIKEIKEIQKKLVNYDMSGDDWEEKQEVIQKLEDVVSYLKDALAKGIEF